jgi:beta-lactamase regulating signal transducer with metallopeptidase domain
MSAEVCLHFAATFLSYFLRVTAAFIACWMLNRLLAKPRQRFIVWMVFLLSSAAYWLELVVSEIKVLVAGTAGVANAPVSASTIKHSFLLPLAWSHNTLIAIQSLGAVYVAISVSLIGMAVWKHVRMRLLLRHTIDASPALNALFLDISRDMQLSRSRISRTKLLMLPGLASPATAGWWTPRILLPEVCKQIGPTSRVADVLCHELVHVARRDFLWAGLSDIICCFLFFHPAAWKARKAMALQGELACDQEVLEKRPGDCADYADSLTYFVRLRMLQEGFSLGVDFAASTSLGLRIRTILTTPQPVAWWKACSRAIAGLSLIMAFSVLAPVMALSVGFTASLVEHVSNQPPVQTAAGHSRNSGRIPRRTMPSDTPKDSLTTLRVRPYVPETPAYTMTSSSNPVVGSAGSSTPEQESPAWRENRPATQHPSVSDVIRTTLGEIAARGTRTGRNHDRDDHYIPLNVLFSSLI